MGIVDRAKKWREEGTVIALKTEIESLRAKLAKAEKDAEKSKVLYEQIKSTAMPSDGFDYQCVKCGYLYNVLNLGDSEDCPICGCDGTIYDAIAKQKESKE